MKRRVICIAIVFVLVVLSMPVKNSTAKIKAGTEFSVTASIYVSGDYIHHEVYPGNGGYIDVAVNEPMAGVIETATGWTDIEGAELTSTHTGVVMLDPNGESLVGSIVGRFTFITESGLLNGHIWADVNVSLLTGIVTDTGTFKINNGTGSFKGTKADGVLEATLYSVFATDENGMLIFDENGMPIVETYEGFITLTGQYE